MKKLILSASVLVVALFVNAQNYEWNFGNDRTNFPEIAGYPDGATINGLTISSGNANMGQTESSQKTWNDVTYEYRFKFNGAGYTGASVDDETPSTNMPSQRYISFAVDGNVTILVHGITGSSSQARRIFVTDGTGLIGTVLLPAGSDITEHTVNYTGNAATLYMFCNQACNLYYLRVTSETSSVNGIPADKGEVVSTVYFDVTGKKITSETTGLVIKRITYSSGLVETVKDFIRESR